MKKVKKEKTERKSSVCDTILNSVVSGVDAFAFLPKMPSYNRSNYYHEFLLSDEEWGKIQMERKQRQELSRLRKKKWLEDGKKGDEIVVKLNKDAMIQGLKAKIRSTTKKLPEGSFCLVLFDFPVGANNARKAWRHFLASADFEHDQLSVWLSKKDVVDDVEALARLLGIEDWVNIYLAMCPFYPR
jgi:hypothetical protein